MPVFDEITFSAHALLRMHRRRLSREDVALVLRIGEGHPDEDDTWHYDLHNLRVVVVERGTAAHVVTVIRLRRHT